MVKTVLAGLACVAFCGVAVAGPGFRGHHGGPHGGPGMHFRGGPRPGPGPGFHHHHHYYSGWGRGGRNFWPGFAGGVVGGLLYDAIVPRTTIVTTPTVVTTPAVVAAPTVVTTPTVVAAPATTVQSVWVNGCYVDQVQANGTVIRVWQPGHYEQRTVYVQ